MSAAYLLALGVSLAGMVILDHRFTLFLFRSPGRAGLVLGAGVLFFLAWDLAGIALGIFFRGQTPYMTGWLLAPELPVEELVFLTLLCYLTMNVYAAAERVAGRRRGR